MLSAEDSPEQAQDIYRSRFESCLRKHHARLLEGTAFQDNWIRCHG
jgi:hypothetical protein